MLALATTAMGTAAVAASKGAAADERRARLAVAVDDLDLGRKRVIQRRFNVAVPRARVPKKDGHVRDRSER